MDVKPVTTDLIAKYATNDPFELAETLGIQIVDFPLKTTLGYYNKYVRVQTILLSSNMPEEMRRFVCAHELGHAICHPNTNTKKLKMYTLFSVDKIEREANCFAVELLMPDAMIKEYEAYPIYEIAKIAGIPQGLAALKKI